MTRDIADFLQRGTTFARKFPDAVLAMPAPELAIEPHARARHYRSTCEMVRERMVTTARLALRDAENNRDLFTVAAPRRPTSEKRQTA